jgi:hypothetical protein
MSVAERLTQLTQTALFFNITFHAALEGMYTKIGDPRSNIADFHMVVPKKALKNSISGNFPPKGILPVTRRF